MEFRIPDVGGEEEKDDDKRDASDTSSNEESSEDATDFQRQKIFPCPEEGCTKTFVKYSAMERHCEYGTHSRALEKLTLQDKAKISYAEHLQEIKSNAPPSLNPRASTIKQSVRTNSLKMGWALKSNPKKSRFSEKQKSFLEKKFLQGEQSGSKSNPEEVASEMRKVRGDDDKCLFSIDEFLSVQQISSYFSRFAAKS